MSPKATTIFTVTSATILGGLIAYAIYFDYRRRNDDEFRKKLRKDKKKVKAAQSVSADTSSPSITPEEIRAALLKIRDEELPKDQEEKERFFLASVDVGERLCAQGPTFYFQAAQSFYRALRVYPSPVELVMIYQKTVPPPVFKLVMDMMNMDVSVPPTSSQMAPEKQRSASPEEDETSPTRTGPPSETSSQEWDNVTDPGTSHPSVP